MKVLGVIQCRLASTRLPGKALADLAGRPVLAWVIERTRRARNLDGLVLATPATRENDILADIAATAGLPVVRGPEDDVLARYCKALDQFPAASVVRITADNPLTAPHAIDELVGFAFDEDTDYAYVARYPYGGGADWFRADLLRGIDAGAAAGRAREHINTHILDNHLGFRIRSLLPPPSLQRPDVRLTLDTPADFVRLQGIFARLPDPSSAVMTEIIAAYDSLPAGARA